MSALYETVGYEVADSVATVTLNRPEGLNSWNLALGLELSSALSAAAKDSDIRAVVVTGAGRAFCSGADLRGGFPTDDAGKPDLAAAIRANYNPSLRAIRNMPKPVIAAVNGPAVGIGCSLALVCDLVVAAQSSYFLLAFANIGLSIDGGISSLLAARVGLNRASEFALLAGRVSAEEALSWNMINRVLPDDELQAGVGELAARLAAGPPGAYAAIKSLLTQAHFPDFEATLEREAVVQRERGVSADFAEGVAAFMEKRPAQFTGR
jgi:2-(1,2-epoxy-1,2-dihydrophenyl)acetyl-CoA isomerase